MQKPNIQNLTDFLILYTTTLLSAGTYTSRVAKCVGRIAEVYGYEVNINFFFHHITLSIVDINDKSIRRTYVIPIHHAHINFKIILKLSALSWAIYDHKYELYEAKGFFDEIVAEKKYPFVFNLFFVSMANFAFCRLFGGDFAAGILVCCGTFVGFNLRYFLTKIKIDLRIQYIICSFLSSYIVFLGVDMDYTNTADIALGSSILYLIPGVFFINSVIDILKDHILMGLSRIVSVGILVCCIALGIYATLSFSDFGLLK